MPECNSMDANYYVRNGMYYNEYIQSAVTEVLNNSISNKVPIVTFKFANNEVYQAARDNLINDRIPEAAGNLAIWYGLDETWYHYIDDDALTKITVFWQFP
ncbi:MAG: hypothetical protein ACK5LL_12635 [Suipraeoptans sp.]